MLMFLYFSDMLKYAVGGRVPIQGYTAVSSALQQTVKSQPQIIKILLTHAIFELEKITNKAQTKGFKLHPVTQESPHPYNDNCDIVGNVNIPGRYILGDSKLL